MNNMCKICNKETMVDGEISRNVGFIPRNRKFLNFTPVVLLKARMCKECGYIDLFGDVSQLNKMLSK